MSFTHNAEGIRPTGGFNTPIPDGEYPLRITDALELTSKNGHRQVKVDFIVTEGQYANRKIRYHYVTFSPKGNKGAGMAIHFLKTIGEPWEGQFVVNANNWVGKTLRAKVKSEEYNGRTNNKIDSVDAPLPPKPEVIETVPF